MRMSKCSFFLLLFRVKAWYSKESDEDQYRIINFSLFVAELFSRIKLVSDLYYIAYDY